MAIGGEDSTFWTIIVAAGTLLVNFFGLVWTAIRGSREMDEKIAAKDRLMTEEFIELERRIKNDIVSESRNIGETMSAVRAKITEIELWGRDHYVDKGTFQVFVADWRRSWERFEEKLDRRLDKIDEKLGGSD